MQATRKDATLSLNASTATDDGYSMRLLGVRIDNVYMESALDRVMSRLADGHPSMVAFVNAHCMNQAFRDRGYVSALDRFDCVFADGIGMRLAGWWLGHPIRENVNGTDMFPLLCARLEHSGCHVFLLGGETGVAEQVREWVEDYYPGVKVCGTHDGYFSENSTKQVAAAIRRARTDLLLVAFGVPAQEKWVARNMASTGARVAMGVGGLFDFYSGRVSRAPDWMRSAGLEWLYRLVQEPGRLWRRYVVGNPLFLLRVLLNRTVSGPEDPLSR